MSVHKKLQDIPTRFDEGFLFEISCSALIEHELFSEAEEGVLSPYTIYSALENAVFGARIGTQDQERAHFLELLEIMLWAVYKYWKPLAKNAALENAKISGSLSSNKNSVIKEFRENLSCKEGAVLRGYLKH